MPGTVNLAAVAVDRQSGALGARRQCLACLVYCLLVALPTSPDVAADTDASNTSSVALFPAASNAHREGFVRVINRAEEAGEIQVAAIDDAGMRIEGAVLAIGPNETRHFNSRAISKMGTPKRACRAVPAPVRATGAWNLARIWMSRCWRISAQPMAS